MKHAVPNAMIKANICRYVTSKIFGFSADSDRQKEVEQQCLCRHYGPSNLAKTIYQEIFLQRRSIIAGINIKINHLILTYTTNLKKHPDHPANFRFYLDTCHKHYPHLRFRKQLSDTYPLCYFLNAKLKVGIVDAQRTFKLILELQKVNKVLQNVNID